jgi:hypothetical protein
MCTHQINDNDTIAAIVRGLDPVDWDELRLIARLSPSERVLRGLRAAEREKAALRETLAKQFPDLSRSELNMMVLAHFTPVQIDKDWIKKAKQSQDRQDSSALE